MSDLRLRQGARALVVDERDRVLLVRFEFADGELWAAPGGGLEDGETALAAVRRELHEEVGLVDPDIGPAIWTRRHVVPILGYDGLDETYFLVQAAIADLRTPLLTAGELRDENVTGHAWWTVEELRDAHTRFAPRRLPSLVADLLVDGPPADPIDVGV